MSTPNTNALLKNATMISQVTAGNTSSSSTSMSFGVVYHKNGKRITINKKLAEALGLDNRAHIAFIKPEGVIAISKDLSSLTDQYINIDLRDEKDSIKGGVTGKKIGYSSDAAYGIVHTFELDFTEHSSRNFKTIELDTTTPDSPVAIIKIVETDTSTTEANEKE